MPEYTARKEEVDVYGDESFEFNPDEGERVITDDWRRGGTVVLLIAVPVDD